MAVAPIDQRLGKIRRGNTPRLSSQRQHGVKLWPTLRLKGQRRPLQDPRSPPNRRQGKAMLTTFPRLLLKHADAALYGALGPHPGDRICQWHHSSSSRQHPAGKEHRCHRIQLRTLSGMVPCGRTQTPCHETARNDGDSKPRQVLRFEVASPEPGISRSLPDFYALHCGDDH